MHDGNVIDTQTYARDVKNCITADFLKSDLCVYTECHICILYTLLNSDFIQRVNLQYISVTPNPFHKEAK